MAGFISERVAGFKLECLAGFVGIRISATIFARKSRGISLKFRRARGALLNVI